MILPHRCCDCKTYFDHDTDGPPPRCAVCGSGVINALASILPPVAGKQVEGTGLSAL